MGSRAHVWRRRRSARCGEVVLVFDLIKHCPKTRRVDRPDCVPENAYRLADQVQIDQFADPVESFNPNLAGQGFSATIAELYTGRIICGIDPFQVVGRIEWTAKYPGDDLLTCLATVSEPDCTSCLHPSTLATSSPR